MGLVFFKVVWDFFCRGRIVGFRWKVLEFVRGWDLLFFFVIAF